MSSLPNVLPNYLNGSCVFDIALLERCVTSLNLWNNLYGPINNKFIILIADLTKAQTPPAGKTNPYAADGKILVAMKLMYRTKEAFATWENDQSGTQEVAYQNSKSEVYCLIDQYEIGMYAPPYKQPIIL